MLGHSPLSSAPLAALTDVGTPKQVVLAVGIASAEGFGAPVIYCPQDIAVVGIATGESFGLAGLLKVALVFPEGIASGESLGAPGLQLYAIAFGIPSAEAFGTAAITVLISCQGVPSTAALGVPVMQRAGLGLTPHEASAWSVVVILGGEDVSGRIIGDIVIEAEEGAARLADFALAIAPTTPIVLSAFTGRSVTIDYTDGGAPVRLFTGVVELPAYDYTRRTITFRCTDDLPGVVAGMSRAAIDAVLLGSHYSSAVFAPTVDQWQYARDRSSTLAGSFDLSPAGALRYTPWVAASSGDYEFTAARLLDGAGPEVALANRSAIKNRISIAFDFRFPRCKRRAVSIGGSIGGSDVALWADFLTAGRWLLPRDTVREALSGDGWVVRGGAAGISFTAAPPTGVYNDALGNATVWNNAAPESICLGFSATLTRCYAQWIDERYTLVVENAASVAALGELPEAEQHAMEAAFDVAAWETAANAQPTGGDFAGDHAEPTLPDAAAGEISVDYFADPERNRAAAEAAVRTLVAAAQARIHAAHRQNGVRFAVPIVPALDTAHTVGVSVSGLAARGKVRVVSHRLSLDSGEASTTVDLAICALQGLGLPSPVSPAVAPPPPAAAAISPTAVLACEWTYANLPADDHQFVVTFPAIDADSRDHYAPAVTQTYSARLVEDLFEVTA